MKQNSYWSMAIRKFSRDRWGMTAFGVVLMYLLVAILVWFGVLGVGWEELANDDGYSGVSSTYFFGTNINGQDIFQRAIYSTKTAFEIGLVVAVLSIVLGTVLGALAGFHSGKWIDHVVVWLYGCIDTIPLYLLVAAISFIFQDPIEYTFQIGSEEFYFDLSLYSMHFAMISTFWTGPAKVIRAQVMKIKQYQFVEAARVIGVPQMKIVLKHLIPNTTHIMLVELTILFVSAIKSEVILSFLGLGVKDGVSWGLMLAEASSEVITGFFNNFLAASVFMFILVMAFNQFSDALQDALDPKKVG